MVDFISPGLTGNRRHNPSHDVEQKELRSASQWFLRGNLLFGVLYFSLRVS